MYFCLMHGRSAKVVRVFEELTSLISSFVTYPVFNMVAATYTARLIFFANLWIASVKLSPPALCPTKITCINTYKVSYDGKVNSNCMWSVCQKEFKLLDDIEREWTFSLSFKDDKNCKSGLLYSLKERTVLGSVWSMPEPLRSIHETL